VTDSGTPIHRTDTPGLLPAPRWIILGFLFLLAAGVRLYRSADPPLNFHATRQYRSLIIARNFYFDYAGAVPEWQKAIARCSRAQQGILEPPIMEFVVAGGYRVLGGERLWFPRLLTTIFWLTGGGFLYLIGKRISDRDAALFAVAFYLFLPFGTVASRSFQPDPLMVMLMLASVWAILRYHDAPSRAGLATASALSSLGFVIKPGSVFVILAAFVALAIQRHGLRRGLRSSAFGTFVLVTLAPTLAIYGYGIAIGEFLVDEATKTVLPQLWISPFFWRGWLLQIDSTVGFVCFIGALLGALSFPRGVPRSLILALWVGYVAFCLALSYNLATHDYYQLQLIPIVGLSLGPVVALVMRWLHDRQPARQWRLAIWGVWALALALSLADARARLVNPSAGQKVAIQREIGEQVRHSTRTIFLSADYGVPLEYHGLLCGRSWPLGWDLEWERLVGRPALAAEERFDRRYAGRAPEYFIVEDLGEFAKQPDLQRFLSRFPIVAQNDEYVIFSLGES
jgi:4-amino-4-deoxy-L-arabinose transferase-like glycosyltransferase